MDNPYPICENCIFADVPLGKDPCHECNRAFLAQRIKPNFVSKRKPMTNADKIRAMSDSELSRWLAAMRRNWECIPKAPLGECGKMPCSECWLNWLQEEAPEE